MTKMKCECDAICVECFQNEIRKYPAIARRVLAEKPANAVTGNLSPNEDRLFATLQVAQKKRGVENG